MRELEKIFNGKKTENGDKSFISAGSNLIDILFKSQYYRNHLDRVRIGSSQTEQLFSMFMRDPRNGIGERELGRVLMSQSGVVPSFIVKCGRFDDLLYMDNERCEDFFIHELISNNYLAKKWSPRLTSKDRLKAKKIRKKMKMSEMQYRKFIKCDTVENRLSHNQDIEDFSKVPSLAFLKYFNTFLRKYEDRFKAFLESVKKGESKINVSVTNPFDICRMYEQGTLEQREGCDVLFNQLPKINLGSILPIVDNSGSMYDSNNSYLKARAIGHYVAKNSSYANNSIVAFSSEPRLIKMGNNYKEDMSALDSFDDVSSTDLGKVMKMLRKLKTDVPDYLLILSDMEFDMGSSKSKDKTMKEFKDNGFNTKIIWWNFNIRNETCPETDEYGNIFMSGYSPQLLRFLESGFNGEEFLNKLLQEYANKLEI